MLSVVKRGQDRVAGVIFRRKDGTRQAFGVIGCVSGDPPTTAIVILERQPQPWRAPPLSALSSALDRRLPEARPSLSLPAVSPPRMGRTSPLM